MSTIHPQWQSDDGESIPVRIAGEPQDNAIPLTAISRRPAAIVGMIAVVAMGAAAFNLHGNFAAQVTQETMIRITANGFSPQSVSVRPGATIHWRNDDAIPHIVASSTLNTEETSPLESLPIFPGEEYAAVVTQDTAEGTYDYISRTSDFNGTIVVSAPAPPPEAASSMPEQTASSRPGMTMPPVGLPPSTTAPRAAIPVNPYTVDKAGMRPQSQTGSAMGGSVLPQTRPPAMTQTKTKPASQPASGPTGASALVLAAAIGVAVLWRKALAA